LISTGFRLNCLPAAPGELPFLLLRFGRGLGEGAPSAARVPYSTAPSMPS
jgi:hypothetical protein